MAMDDNHNVDGFDGLPLDLWMTPVQQPHMTSSHSSLPTTVYHQSPNTMRDYMPSMTMSASFSAGGSTSHQSQSIPSSSTQQQYSHSSSTRPSHQDPHTSVSERSAWSQLLAMDPTVFSVGTHSARPEEPYTSMHNLSFHETQHCQGPRDQSLLSVKSTGGSQLTVPYDSRALPSMQFSPASTASFATSVSGYLPSSHLSLAENKASQHFNELMNLSRKMAQSSRITEPAILSTPPTAPSLESSGGYSPVSPPMTASDEPSTTSIGFSSGKVAELMLRDSHEVGLSTHPSFSESRDIFSYISQKSDFSNESNFVDSTADPRSSQMAISSTLLPFVPSPSNSPLDMTTGMGSKYNKTWQEPALKIPSHTDTGLRSTSASTSTVGEQVPLLQTLLSKKPVLPVNVSNDVTVVPADEKKQPDPGGITFQERISKPMRSTPKKSNFYGRDASLFSFSSPQQSDSGLGQVLSSSETANMVNQLGLDSTPAGDVISMCSTDGEVSLGLINAVPYSEAESAPRNNVSCASSADVTSNVTASAANQGDLAAVLESSLETAVNGNVSINAQLGQDIHNKTYSSEYGVETLSVGEEEIAHQNDEVQSENTDTGQHVDDFDGSINHSENSDETNAKQPMQNPTKSSFEEETLKTDLNISTADDSSQTVTVSNKIKLAKRKKRKATGFQTKPRKKPVRKKKGAQMTAVSEVVVSPQMTDEMEIDGTDPETVQGTDNEKSTNDLIETQPSARKRPGLKTKSSNQDAAPRRSSSRKSKDNAMRLIELQADSNYNGIAESTAVATADINKKPGRKRKRQDISKPLVDEDSELTENDESLEESDEKDGDYVIDEAEAEMLDNDKKLEEQIGLKRKPKEKKHGGLKISIKLSGNSSAEIVSGISDSSVKKKRKISKKKLSKKQETRKSSIEELDSSEEPKQELSGTDDDSPQSTANSSLDGKSEQTRDRHMSLMEKYFSTANSATVAQQMKKKSATKQSGLKKKSRLKSEDAKVGKGKIKASKSALDGKKLNQADGSIQKQKSSVKFSLDTAAGEKDLDMKDDSETSVPKFVCGYCPQRYHNKDDLRAHMEDHMVEMERKNNASEDQGTLESKKSSFSSVNHNSSRDPRSQRSDPSGNVPLSKASSSDKVKLKSNTEHTRDFAVKPASVVVKQVFNCGECGQVFNSKPNLLDHVRIHTAEKPFECDICHKCFTERHLLSVHRKAHDQEKLLRCQMCSKAFVHKADLDFHMQSHPKRSANVLSGKKLISAKKSSKKVINDRKDADDATVPKKPKSFASALSGDLDVVGKDKDAPAVLVLKRGDATPAESKNCSGSLTKTNESKVIMKQGASAISVGKNSDILKKPTENPVSSNKTKSEDQKAKANFRSNSDVQNSIEKRKGEPSTGSSNICTCKECPECVTRFLQSFE